MSIENYLGKGKKVAGSVFHPVRTVAKIVFFPVKLVYGEVKDHVVAPPFRVASYFSSKFVKKNPHASKFLAPPVYAAAGKGLEYIVDRGITPFVANSIRGVGEKIDGYMGSSLKSNLEGFFNSLPNWIHEGIKNTIDLGKLYDFNIASEKAAQISDSVSQFVDRLDNFLPYVGAALGAFVAGKIIYDERKIKNLERDLEARCKDVSSVEVREVSAKSVVRNELSEISSYCFDEVKKLDNICRGQTGKGFEYLVGKVVKDLGSNGVDYNQVRVELGKGLLWYEVMNGSDDYKHLIKKFSGGDLVGTERDVGVEVESHLKTLFNSSYKPKSFHDFEDVKSGTSRVVKYAAAALATYGIYTGINYLCNRFGLDVPGQFAAYVSAVYPISRFGVVEDLVGSKEFRSKQDKLVKSVVENYGLNKSIKPVDELEDIF